MLKFFLLDSLTIFISTGNFVNPSKHLNSYFKPPPLYQFLKMLLKLV